MRREIAGDGPAWAAVLKGPQETVQATAPRQGQDTMREGPAVRVIASDTPFRQTRQSLLLRIGSASRLGSYDWVAGGSAGRTHG